MSICLLVEYGAILSIFTEISSIIVLSVVIKGGFHILYIEIAKIEMAQGNRQDYKN